MLVLASIVFLSGQASGLAGKAECKATVDGRTGFAVPPPSIRGDQLLVACFQFFQESPPYMKCVYSNEEQTACTVLFDLPGEKMFRGTGINCQTGEPLKESKL